MPVTDNQPVSASNLAASLNLATGGGLSGNEPVSVGNLKAVLDAMGQMLTIEELWSGTLQCGTIYDGELTINANANDYYALRVTVTQQYTNYAFLTPSATQYGFADVATQESQYGGIITARISLQKNGATSFKIIGENASWSFKITKVEGLKLSA